MKFHSLSTQLFPWQYNNYILEITVVTSKGLTISDSLIHNLVTLKDFNSIAVKITAKRSRKYYAKQDIN